MNLHIDIETYSSVNLKSSGMYKYMQSLDFEILMVAYAFDNDPIQLIDFTQGEELPEEFVEALTNPNIIKHAHNAAFERNAFKVYGYNIPVSQWQCTAIKSAYCGLPLSLAQVSKALRFGDGKAKLSTGKSLIRYFCIPCKPTKTNGQRSRNLPSHAPDKWEDFKTYCITDVEAERAIADNLDMYTITDTEQLMYQLDQKINDVGILIDLPFASKAYSINTVFCKDVIEKIKNITGLDNPNSPDQLKTWLSKAMNKEITSLAKATIQPLIDEAGPGLVTDVLNMRKTIAKTSIKKYVAMKNCAGDDNRARGLFQFYGASRTGRWAGRLIQLQNLPRNYLRYLKEVRTLVAEGQYTILSMLYSDIPDTLSQLIRTAFVAPKNHVFVVSDFSAIEARVIAWLAGEEWRIEIFKTHGMIYEASASMMFGLPFEECTKEANNGIRAKGKVAELALGYQGSIGAMKNMGGESMGLSEKEMRLIVTKWRSANKKIVRFWEDCNKAAIRCIISKKKMISGLLTFRMEGPCLTVELPSGRKLFYREPSIGNNNWGHPAVSYKGMSQTTRQWVDIDTYGGKLCENIVQAVARDLLVETMLKLDSIGRKIVMHVHDEVVFEIPEDEAEQALKDTVAVMGEDIPWAKGLPLSADGYITPFYKKD